MILCEYTELKNYSSILPELPHALNCVEELRKQGFPTGRYEYEGGFLFVQRGTTKPYQSDAYEAHRKYIDVQYMIDGGEAAYYLPLDHTKESKAYDKMGDIAFYTPSEGDGTKLEIQPGMCWTALPSDAHMPCRIKNMPNAYLKIVMKLPWKGEEK